MLLVLTVGVVIGQKIPPKTQLAIDLLENGQLIEAKEQILIALKDQNEAKNEFSWLTKAYIYKELYKEVEAKSKYSEYREIAVDALLHSMELDDDKSMLEDHRKAVSFLAISYFNDAVDLVTSLNKENLNEAPKFYERYRQMYPLADPEAKMQKKDTEFYNKYAFELRKLSMKEEETDTEVLQKSIEAYEHSLAINPNDTIANYNLAVIHYNRGAQKIRKINYQTEIIELITIQDECLKHFKTALPYMLRTNELDPQNRDSLKGLMAIYKAMNEDARSAEYKDKLAELIKSGN
jgi:hypothetical protein